MSKIKKKIKQERQNKHREKKQIQQQLDKRKVVGYCRVSTDKQESEGYGLDYQITRINDYSKRNNLKIDQIYQEAFTGKVDDREQFEILTKEIKANKVKTLIAYKLDRLGRSQLNVLKFVDLLKQNNVQLITLEPEIDYNTQAGQIILSNLTMFAELERNMIVERTESGRIQKFNQGTKCQGTILGYQHDKKTKRYEIIPEEASLVKYIFGKYISYGMTVRRLVKYLNDIGFTTKRGKEFKYNSLYKILTNRFYIGSAFYKGKEIKGNHEAIISRVLFGKVIGKMEKKKKK